jgi:Rrf2 family protein
MKLSSKSMYAVRALFNMAYNRSTTPSKIDDIARGESMPPRFLEQIFQDLKKAGILGSKRGPKGGYFLTRAPEEISLRDVVAAMEGSTQVSFCRESSAAREQANDPTTICVTSQVWKEVAGAIDSVLESVTLKDLVERGESMGIKREGFNEFIYII